MYLHGGAQRVRAAARSPCPSLGGACGGGMQLRSEGFVHFAGIDAFISLPGAARSSSSRLRAHISSCGAMRRGGCALRPMSRNEQQ